MHDIIVAIVDRSFYLVGAVFAAVCLLNVYKSFKRGFVYINGKKAFRSEDRLGFWLVTICWIGVAVFIAIRIISAFRDGTLP